MALLKLATVMTVVLFLTAGCGFTGGDGDRVLGGDGSTARNLVQRDLDQLARSKVRVSTTSDDRYQSRFVEIFGGTTGQDVRAYIDQRIQHFFGEADLRGAYVTPNPVNTGYSQNLFHQETVQAVRGASNIGMGIWFQGLIDRNVITLHVPSTGQSLRVESPRAGIMEVGPGYRYSTVSNDGLEFVIPTEYRQAILVHEARHSDCTGGTTEAALEIARNATDIRQFAETYPRLSCGHMHVFCPSWHKFAGLAACDKNPWGAYAIEHVYAGAVASADGDYITYKMMQYVRNDTASRLLYVNEGPSGSFDISRLLDLEFGRPNMTTSGVVAE